jgi:hypothetical protein
MTFAELAPRIRQGIRERGQPRRLFLLMYLLRRKVQRQPRLPKFESPEMPDRKPDKTEWPKLSFKGKNPMLRAKSRRFLSLVDKLAAKNVLCNSSVRWSLYHSLVRSSGDERSKIESIASGFLPEQDALKFNQWLEENHEAALSHHEQMLKYREALEKYAAREAALQIAHGKKLEHWAKLLGTKLTILSNIEKEVGEYLSDSVTAIRVPWRILPADEDGYAFLDAWLENQARLCGGHEERLQRIEFAKGLTPSHLVEGSDDFDGYVAFIYDWTESVLLERAQNGNAAYIIHQHWTSLARLSRRQLQIQPGHLWDRVIHNNEMQWQWAIKRALLKGKKNGVPTP